MIYIEHLQVKYDDFVALDINEPITIDKGDRIGIIGSNGAGKTTFVKAILGLVGCNGKISSKLKFSDMAVHMQENNYVKTVPVKYIIQAVLNTSIQTIISLQLYLACFSRYLCRYYLPML